jgi:hypothetical protein
MSILYVGQRVSRRAQASMGFEKWKVRLRLLPHPSVCDAHTTRLAGLCKWWCWEPKEIVVQSIGRREG